MVEVKKDNDSEIASINKPLDPEHFRKLFIGGLSLNTSDEALKEFYSKFGELLDCVVMRDAQTKKSRGFGFVTFSTKEEVDKAMKGRPHEIDGKTVDPKRAVPRDQSNRSESNISTKRMYVSGVREDHTEEDFKDHFNNYGEVQKVEIMIDKNTGKPRGFAFVTFDDYDAVDQCVLQKSHMIKDYRCDVKKALSKEDAARAQQVGRDRLDRSGRSRGNQRNGGGYGNDRYNQWQSGPPKNWGGAPPQWGPPGGYPSYGGSYGAGGYGGGGSLAGWNAGGNPSSWDQSGQPPAAPGWQEGGWSSGGVSGGWGTQTSAGQAAVASGQWSGGSGNLGVGRN